MVLSTARHFFKNTNMMPDYATMIGLASCLALINKIENKHERFFSSSI